MAKDPAFLFYPGDWIQGTMHLTFLEKGCYMELLMLQFNRGKFTIEQAKHMLQSSFEVAWPTISEKFVYQDGFYWNERLALEKEKRSKFTESRRNNGKVEKNKEATNKHMLTHMDNHMENVNKDVIENKEKPKKPEIPALQDFIQYYKTELSLLFPDRLFGVEAKYEAWKDAGWKDGYGNKIINWKSKLKNTILKISPTGFNQQIPQSTRTFNPHGK
jgi:uncharacterized protein YdaU (DUF1376 family)